MYCEFRSQARKLRDDLLSQATNKAAAGLNRFSTQHFHWSLLQNWHACMLTIGFEEMFHRSVLIVEADEATADCLAKFVTDNGGEVVARVSTTHGVSAALSIHPRIDSVYIDADIRSELALPLVRQFERQHMHTVWIMQHERFAGTTADDRSMPAVYRLAGDPPNVMRVNSEC